MKKIILLLLLLAGLLKNIATGQYWSALGGGVGYPEWQLVYIGDGTQTGFSGPATGPPVASFCFYKGELYAAGYFDIAGNIRTSNIVKWNGTNWSTVGSGIDYSYGYSGYNDHWVYALAVYNGELYVGGHFMSAGGIQVNNIAKWNGTTWSAVGNGLGSHGNSVGSLLVHNGELYASGYFYKSGNIPVKNIARWNGTEWSTVGAGIEVFTDTYLHGSVNSLTVHNGSLYAGGFFDTAGNVALNNIAKWDGTNWSAVGSGIDSIVYTMTSYNGNLYSGGGFQGIKKWDGINWSSLASGVNGSVYSFAAYNGDLIAGGYFDTAGSIAANNIAKWNGTSWSALGNGINKGVTNLISHEGSLYAGGNFTMAGNVWVNRVAKWTAQCLSVPVQPTRITGSQFSCKERYTSFFIDPITDVAEFTWTLPPGWQGASNSNHIVVLAGTKGGTISVTANNPCGSSTKQTLEVSVKDTVPFKLDTILGKITVCKNSTESYSIPPVPAATSYIWSLPWGWTGHSTTNNITVETGTNGGNISVMARNDCSFSSGKSLNIKVDTVVKSLPDIQGKNFVSVNEHTTYSINTVNTAALYNWSISGGGTILSGQNTNSINVSWHHAGTYMLTVKDENGCGPNTETKLIIHVSDQLDDPFSIKLLPNPSTGLFYLNVKSIRDKMISVDIYNLNGQLIRRGNKKPGTNNYSELINLEKMPRGFYALKILISDQIYLRSVVITN